mmetsp:Transcript_71904/g.204013  ORF Transcript_71904/g.204013 Transcript_71904/m.204013 type:complete len:275 (+) Transcript_71904:305-1129(+)
MIAPHCRPAGSAVWHAAGPVPKKLSADHSPRTPQTVPSDPKCAHCTDALVDKTRSGSPHNNVYPLLCVYEVTELPNLQCKSCIIKGLAVFAGLHPAEVAHQVTSLQAAWALGELLATCSESTPLGVALALLEDRAEGPLGLAARALDLLIPHLVDGTLALAVLQEDVPQPDLRGLLLSRLLLWRRICRLNPVEENNNGAQPQVTNLPKPLHGCIYQSTRRHAGSAGAPLEDRGHRHTSADGVVQGPADEGKTVVLVLQLQDLDFWCREQFRHAV